MRNVLFLAAAAIAVLGGLASCGKSSAPETTTTDIVSLTPDQREQFATIANMNGLLCAKIIEARKREAKTYYIECETYRDKLERRAYTIDLATGKAR